MRDLLLTALLIGFLPVAVKRPFLGALIFALISLANPHRFTWGFAYSMPWAMAYAGATMLGLFLTQERFIGDSIRRYLPILIYLAWMAITTAFAFSRDDASYRWQQIAKVHLMCLITLSLLTDWERVKQLTWVTVCSVSFFGLKGGVFTLREGGEALVWGPPDSAIADNNHLAVGLVMMLPLLYWLYTDTHKKWLRGLIALTALMSAISIFGSHSRSAFLGIAAMSILLLLKSRHKFVVGIVGLIVAGLTAVVMPDKYWERMETIRTYQEDASAMGRINVWYTAYNIANARLTGGGFEYYSPQVFARYAPEPDDVHSSHSIYFQALGEHGWIGFILFIIIWLYVWFTCRRIIKHAPQSKDGASQALLARMTQVSLVGFAVGGAFVNIGNWDMVYYIAISVLALSRLIPVKLSARTRSPLPSLERRSA